MGDDGGAASILVIGVVAGALTLALATIAGGAALTQRQRAQESADAAALGAADAASGITGGVPCVIAAEVAGSDGTELAGCRLDGPVVTVGVTLGVAGLAFTAAATAGPPDRGLEGLRDTAHETRLSESRGTPVYGVADSAVEITADA